MDFLKLLFGGGETETTSRPVDVQAPEFQALRGPFAGTLLNQITKGPPKYEGPLTAPLGGNEATLLQQLMGQRDDRQNYLAKAIGGGFLPGTPGANPFLEAAIASAQRPTLQGLEEVLTRSLPGRFTQAGQMIQPQGSSAFDRAAAIATRGVADALSTIGTNMGFGAYESERQRQQQATQISQQDVMATSQILKDQALPRMIEQYGIDKAIELFSQMNTQVLDIMRILAGVTAPAIGTESQTKGEQTGGIIPGLRGLFGGK